MVYGNLIWKNMMLLNHFSNAIRYTLGCHVQWLSDMLFKSDSINEGDFENMMLLYHLSNAIADISSITCLDIIGFLALISDTR